MSEWFERDPAEKQESLAGIRLQLQQLETARNASYDTLKRRLRRIRWARDQRKDLSIVDVQRLVDLIGLEKGFKTNLCNILNSNISDPSATTGWAVVDWVTGRSSKERPKQTASSLPTSLPTLPSKRDPVFVAELQDLLLRRPEYIDAINKIKVEILNTLESKIKKLLRSLGAYEIKKVTREKLSKEVDQEFSERFKTEEAKAWQDLKITVQKGLLEEPNRDG